MSAENTNKPLIAITRFKSAPGDVEEVKSRYAALVSKCSADRGLVEERLGRTEDGTWVAVWLWDSADALKRTQELAHSWPEAQAAFALAADVTSEIVLLEAS